jgi:Ca2+-binding EF-hand superfamily protein
MNQTDWSNLFNLLDADKSGTIELEEMKALFQQETTGKLDNIDSIIKNGEEEIEKEEEPEDKEKGE